MHTHRNGFTLIELLVVIAIIAILAAILFPVFLAAQAKAKQTQCMGNLKQIGIATTLYMDDNGSRFPLWGGGSATTQGWLGAVQKYAKTKLLGKCPKMIKEPGFSYWRNVYTDRWSPFYGAPPAAMSEMIYPKTTVLLMDGPADQNTNSWHTWWGPPTLWGGVAKNLEQEAETRHGGAADVVFVDTHVSTVKPGGFTTLSTDSSGNQLAPTGYPYGAPTGIWAYRNDGTHPWFRNN